LVGVVACLLFAALGLSYLALASAQGHASDVRVLQGQVRDLQQRVATLAATNDRITGRLQATDRKLGQKEAGIAPLAARVLRSVFRVETRSGWFGTGFAAWTSDGQTYVLTANHVVAHDDGATVTLERSNGSWAGEIAATDPKNGLALIRLEGQPVGAAPLSQDTYSAKPRPATNCSSRAALRARRHHHNRDGQPHHRHRHPNGRRG
jgi:S1-C subfamily serine protease